MQIEQPITLFMDRVRRGEQFIDDEFFSYHPEHGFRITDEYGYVHNVVIEKNIMHPSYSYVMFRSTNTKDCIFCMPSTLGLMCKSKMLIIDDDVYKACSIFTIYGDIEYLNYMMQDQITKSYVLSMAKVKKHADEGHKSTVKLLERLWLTSKVTDSDLVIHNAITHRWLIKTDQHTWSDVLIHAIYGYGDNVWMLFQACNSPTYAIVRLLDGVFVKKGHIICDYDDMLGYINLFTDKQTHQVKFFIEDTIEMRDE